MMRIKQGYVYMLANDSISVIYTGVTSDLIKRVEQHRSDLANSFTKKYHVHKLVYFEQHDTIRLAIEREKQIKAGSRQKKLGLIESLNPRFNDLTASLAL